MGHQESAGKMTQLSRRVLRRRGIIDRISNFRCFFRFIWDRVLVCSTGKREHRYRRLPRRPSPPSIASCDRINEQDPEDPTEAEADFDGSTWDPNLVSLKISLLGDCDIGKTSFAVKYVGDERRNKGLMMKGLNLMDKTLLIPGARIVFRIWDVEGDRMSRDHMPMACRKANAILFMFDLTSRCTLNSVIGWYIQARKWNQEAISIVIGTKFDDFVRLPPNLQWPIIVQPYFFG